MQQYSPRGEVTVRWRPYLLWPDLPPGEPGLNKRERFIGMFGERRFEEMQVRMRATFASVGLDYSVGGNVGNTMDAHRLIAWAEDAGGLEAQGKLVEELMLDHFTREKLVSARSTLVGAAARVDGLDERAAGDVIDDHRAYKDAVLEQMSLARNVRGVPHYTVEGQGAAHGRMVFSGAQEAELILQAFDEVAGTAGR